MSPHSLNPSLLHPKRHEIELRRLASVLEAYWAADSARPDGSEEERQAWYHRILEPLENAILTEFPDGTSDTAGWEIVLREQNWRSILRDWESCGKVIFDFSSQLLEALSRTDIEDMPIQNVRAPFGCFHVALPPGRVLPQYDAQWQIDGLYVTTETCLAEKLRTPPQSPEAALQDAEEYLQLLQDYPDLRDHLANSLVVTNPDAWRAEWMRENAQQRSLHERYMTDPDAVLDQLGARDKGDPYWLVMVDFTFRQRDFAPQPLSGGELLAQPTLRGAWEFRSHRSTVAQSVAEGRAHGLPLETFRETDYRRDDPRNVVSDPAVLDDVTRLVFNIICYLNYPERDQERRFSDVRTAERLKRAAGKSRKAIEMQGFREGHRWIEFCGYRQPAGTQATARGMDASIESPIGHWRRGHWRNQRFGRGLIETKLIWIRPTMVVAEGGILDRRAAVYDMGS